jgi:molybdopterin-guanine dinucleotide biosynthesis protein A
VIGAIVAGGANSRFGGEPKGLRMVDGRRVIDRVASAIEGVADEVIVVANATDAGTWLPGTRVIGDEGPQRGSLVGLHTALKAADGDDVLLVAWDMPFVTGELLRFLRRLLFAPVYAVVPELERGLEPLCAAYSARCLPVVEQCLTKGELRMGDFIDDLPVVRRVGPGELTPFGDPARLFFNVNTVDDLAAAERMARGN